MSISLRQVTPFLSACVVLLLSLAAGAQDHQVVPGKRVGPVRSEVEIVIRKFWDDLGRLDADGLKETMAWPVTIVEASTAGNKQNVLRTPQEFDEEFKRTPEAAVARGKSEFYGTTVAGFSVQMLNANLASVSYDCQLPRDIVGARGPNAARFHALTVLSRDPDHGNKWRIIFITVPK
jgi:hypothetical protein